MEFDANAHKAFFDDLTEEGYHIFSRRCGKIQGFYPSSFPSYPELEISDLKEGDTITIRAFFPTSKTTKPKIESGHIDLEVEHVDHETKKVFGNILTKLPATFALSKGTSIELDLDEMLRYCVYKIANQSTLDRYIKDDRGKKAGVLFCSKSNTPLGLANLMTGRLGTI